MPRLLNIIAGLTIVALPASVGAASPDPFSSMAQPYIQQHCISCHGPAKAKAGFRIDQLNPDFAAPRAAEQWKEVIDRINAGEMPPENKPRPQASQSAEFVQWVNNRLHDMELTARSAGGRIPMRRLNRDEYANTICDLLHLEPTVVRSICEDLPGDGKAEGFDRLGVALFFDQTQVERSMGVAEKLAANAIVTAVPKVNHQNETFVFPRRDAAKTEQVVYPASQHMIPIGVRDYNAMPEYLEYVQGYPTYKKEYEGWGVINHFSIGKCVTQDGYYRFRIKATVDNRSRTTPNKFRLQYGMDSPIQVEQEVTLDPSGTTETILFLRGPDASGEVKGPQNFSLLWNHTEQCVIMEPAYRKAFFHRNSLAGNLERDVTARKPKAHLDEMRRQLDEAIAVLEKWTGPAHVWSPSFDPEKLPRLRISAIEIEGPIQKEWPPRSHKELFFAGDDRKDSSYAREIFARFLPRAYRRPPTPGELDAVVSIVDQAMKVEKMSFPEAMRVALQRVLCSPGFVFLEEPAVAKRAVNDYELASRLSYFLWSTMPDDTLLSLAAQNKLHDRATLAGQVRRMVADPRIEQFVHNFAGQWLAVRDYGSVQPAAEYRDYDKPLERASKEEPFAFVTEVVNKNLPITNFLDSDFVVVNERLAKHYGLSGVSGEEFRRVAIKPEDHRGGVLGMAGLMTYLADGTRTLPMRRARWVVTELLNDPPNTPPPNAGEIQPNTSGKNLTVRQRLDLHRRDEVCASCHTKLDPYGLALENYDAIGAWRDRANGEGMRGPSAPKLDVSGSIAGRKFATINDYKACLLEQKEKFARAFSTKVLTYALCRPVGYTDRQTLDSLQDALRKSDYRIQSLIEGIVLSEPFATK